MNKPDTDFQQFSDAAEFHNRRSTDNMVTEPCEKEDCPAVFILERRVDRHREEINELRTLVLKATEDTTEILEILKMGKSFFRVADWLGTKIMGIAAFFGLIAAFILWVRPGGKP